MPVRTSSKKSNGNGAGNGNGNAHAKKTASRVEVLDGQPSITAILGRGKMTGIRWTRRCF